VHTSHDIIALSDRTAGALREAFPGGADCAVVLGSGLGGFAETLVSDIRIPLSDIPEAPLPGIAGHGGALIRARAGARTVLLFSGRVHGYEGRTTAEQCFPALASAALGVPVYIATNAAGGINPQFDAGELMLISDLIALPLARGFGLPLNALRRVEQSDWSDKSDRSDLSDLSDHLTSRLVLDDMLLAHMRAAALSSGVKLREGVYGYCAGPSYETRAEIAFLRRAGVDAVGMSTFPELLAAHRAGLRIAGISCITNKARTVPTSVSHEEVTTVAAQSSERFSRLLTAVLSTL
jgi:purine-nucleoside phosphorylase